MSSPSSSSLGVTISSYFDQEGLRHVVPYTHVYSTSAKGRWIGMTLLEAFSREFAVVGDEVDCDDGDEICNGHSSGATSSLPSVCTDFRANTLTYAKKMAKGSLFIVGREEECAKAGEASVPIVKEMLARADTIPPRDAEEAVKDTQQRNAWFKELNAKLPLTAVPQKRGVGGGGSPSTAPTSTLRQLDAIRHVVTRREHHINLGDDNQCIEIVAMARERSRGQLESVRAGDGSSSSTALTSANDDCGDQPRTREGPPYYLAINKPSSVAIHPGGRFQTNTLLRLVEDTFSGAKASSTPASTSGRLFVVVDGFSALGDGSGCRSTFVCEPVLESESIKQNKFTVRVADAEGVAVTHVHGRWRPLIRVPHENVLLPLEDRRWLLSLLPAHSVVRIQQEVVAEGGVVIEGLREGYAQCPLVLAESFIHITPPAGTLAADGSANGSVVRVAREGGAARSPLKLFIVHRLDRCTSGIIVFALDTASAKLITDSFADVGSGSRQTPPSGQVVSPADLGSNKKYLARVHGDVQPLFRGEAGTIRAGEGRPSLGFSTVQILPHMSSAATGSPPPALPPIIINSATYCTSFQGATYWCLGAQEEELFESMLAREGGESLVIASTSNKVIGEKRARESANGDALEPYEELSKATTVSCIVPGRGKVAFASVEEKRAAMRQLVASKRKIEVEVDRSGEGDLSVMEGVHVVASVPTPTVSLASSTEVIRHYFNTRYDCLKHARTYVAFVGYDGATDQSVVLCSPLTGRTHQIRIHLASHGFPIVGDTKYFAKGAAVARSLEQVDSAAPNQLGEEDADRICLHALEYTIPEVRGASQKVCTDAPIWCQMPKGPRSMGM